MLDITFEYPFVFLVLVLYFICLKFCKQKKVAVLFPNQALLKKVTKKRGLVLESLKFFIVLFVVVALASPVQKDNIIITDDKGYEISLILDASGSMREADKFTIVKNIVQEFIDKRKHDKIALSIFADFAYVAVPLTYDKNSIKRLLQRVEVGVAGVRQTALYEALFLSSNLFRKSKSKEKIAILLTDGVNNVDTIPLDVAIKTAQKYGIKVYTIGVGDRGSFNPEVLNTISKQTGGKYFSANSIEKLKEVYKTINKLEKSDIKADKYVKKSYYFQYPLGLAMLFLVVYFLVVNRDKR